MYKLNSQFFSTDESTWIDLSKTNQRINSNRELKCANNFWHQHSWSSLAEVYSLWVLFNYNIYYYRYSLHITCSQYGECVQAAVQASPAANTSATDVHIRPSTSIPPSLATENCDIITIIITTTTTTIIIITTDKQVMTQPPESVNRQVCEYLNLWWRATEWYSC